MSKKIFMVLVGVMALSLMACGAKEETESEENANIAFEAQENQSEDNQESEMVNERPESKIPEADSESEVTNETSSTSPLVGRTYIKEDGTTLEILSSDSEGYINAIKLNGSEINLTNIQLVEGHYGPEENTYLGEFNSGLDQIGISYFTTDDSKLIIRFFGGTASDSTLTREIEVDVTQDGTYYLE